MLLISFDEVYSVCWMADGDVSLEQQWGCGDGRGWLALDPSCLHQVGHCTIVKNGGIFFSGNSGWLFEERLYFFSWKSFGLSFLLFYLHEKGVSLDPSWIWGTWQEAGRLIAGYWKSRKGRKIDPTLHLCKEMGNFFLHSNCKAKFLRKN
jgi:hypothetical protein